MTALDLSAQQLWLPGKGLVPPHAREAWQAVKDYDCDLGLARHDESGEWVVTIQRGNMTEPHPIFSLGKELPSRERIQKLLYCNDVRRRGNELFNQILRVQETRQKHMRDEVNDQTGVVAEAFEWAHRKQGTHASPRIFVPRGV